MIGTFKTLAINTKTRVDYHVFRNKLTNYDDTLLIKISDFFPPVNLLNGWKNTIDRLYYCRRYYFNNVRIHIVKKKVSLSPKKSKYLIASEIIYLFLQ